MEFSYKVTLAEFLRAEKLQNQRRPIFVVFRVVRWMILFWVVVLVCLILLWVIVQRTASSPPIAQHQPAGHVGFGHLIVGLALTLGPFLLILGAAVFLLVGLEPMLARRSYRKDPSMQGWFTVNIAQQSIHLENTCGISSDNPWNLYSYWRERKGVIVLMFHSGAYSIMSLAGLSPLQQDELRGILTAALPRK